MSVKRSYTRGAVLSVRLFSAVLLLWSATSLDAITLDEIVDRYVRARGGRSALNSVRSVHMIADVSTQYGTQMTIERVIQRGRKMRDVNTYEGKTTIETFDGQRSWLLMIPEKTATYLSTHSADHFELFADIDGEFVDASSKGLTASYAGSSKVEGIPVHSIKVVDAQGLQRTYHIDTATYFVHSVTILCREHPSEEETIRYLNYTALYGVAFPKGYLVRQGGSVLNIEIQHWKTNDLCGDWMFTPEAISAPGKMPGVAVRASSAPMVKNADGSTSQQPDPPIDDSTMIDEEPTYSDEQLANVVVYPHAARLNAIEGTVLVAVLLGLDGKIERLAVMESPHPLLSDAAAYGVSALTFTPAMLHGSPIRVWKKVPIDFRLQ